MDIIFRIDDIYLNQNNFEIRIFEIFQKHGIPLNIGIIPFDANNLPHITVKTLIPSNLIPCLHGFNHSRTGIFGEFDGLELEEQEQKIKLGKNHLEYLLEQKINCFIPPWNKYDKYTLTAIQNNGLTNISGGQNIKLNESNEIPCGVEHFNLLDKFWFRVILFLLPRKIKLVVLFHNFNFEEHTILHFSDHKYVYNLKKLEGLLIKLKKGGHKFIDINEGRVKKQVFNIFSEIIKKLTGERIRFWI
jgi:hypothetical protein